MIAQYKNGGHFRPNFRVFGLEFFFFSILALKNRMRVIHGSALYMVKYGMFPNLPINIDLLKPHNLFCIVNLSINKKHILSMPIRIYLVVTR